MSKEIKEPELVIAYILENDEDVFPLSYSSTYDIADKVVVIWSGHEFTKDCKSSFLSHYGISDTENKLKVIWRDYLHDYKGANGLQRKHYLEYLQKHHLGDWCLVVDGDEILDMRNQVKEKFMKLLNDAYGSGIDAWLVHMRHIVGTITKEDSEHEEHMCPGRLFKVTKEMYYDEVEHPVLKGNKKIGKIQAITLWHFGYSRELFRLKKKYENHMKKSDIHTPDYLKFWYYRHLVGTHPVKDFDLSELPVVVKDFFDTHDLEKSLYYKDRMELETKYFIESSQWKNFFKHKDVLFCGCGMGQRVMANRMFDIEAYGFDIEEFAIKRCPYNEIKKHICVGDITKNIPQKACDLVVAYDVLEHLKHKELDSALKNLKKKTKKHILISVPFEGDVNLELDKTHIIKQPKWWWIEQISKYFRIIPTPDNFIYKEQIIVGELKE